MTQSVSGVMTMMINQTTFNDFDGCQSKLSYFDKNLVGQLEDELANKSDKDK